MKQIIILLFAAILLPAVAFSQTQREKESMLSGKWTFAEAKVVEKNRTTGKVTKKTLKSEQSIPNETYLRTLPLAIEFFGEGIVVPANVKFQNGTGNVVLAEYDAENKRLFLKQMPTGNEPVAFEQLLEKSIALQLIEKYEDLSFSKNKLFLKYNYTYIVNGRTVIDGEISLEFEVQTK